MPVITSSRKQARYDVVIIGSGAAGGQSAYTLAMEGAKVLMLEAGRNYDPIQETPMFQTNREAPLRGADTPDKPFGFYDATVGGGWNVPGEPYTQASTDPQKQFWWWRSRMLGGRTNHWSRVALRNGPYDFKPYSRDGLGFDWPIAYEDVADYYDKVELLIGVYGTNENIENVPHSSPGVLQPPPKARAGELLARERGKSLGIPIVPAHRAVMTKRLDPATLPARLHPNNPKARRILAEDIQSRAACFWATPCGRGCSIRATYQSTTVHLPPALATGNLDILPNAMAREITVDAAGRATGVAFVDKTTGETHHAAGRAVILAAGSCESVRLLLNSKSSRHPQGLGNSSGRVGRYIMDTVGGGLSGQIPLLENLPPHNEDGAGGAHVYIPWWLCAEQKAGKLDFPRGYHVEFKSGRGEPGMGTGTNLEWLTGGSYGRKLKEDARRYYGSFIGFNGRGEMIPNEKSFCELDPTTKDKWGIPVMRFHWEWSEHETRQAAHMEKTFAALIGAMGGRVRNQPATDGARAIKPGGSIIHEVGGARMGERAADSVTNCWGQVWDSPNVIVADGASFCSSPDKNPTLTIMALAWRAADHLLEEMKKRNIS